MASLSHDLCRLVKCCSYLSPLSPSFLPACPPQVFNSWSYGQVWAETRWVYLGPSLQWFWVADSGGTEAKKEGNAVGKMSATGQDTWFIRMWTFGGSTALLMEKAKENTNIGCWDLFNHPFIHSKRLCAHCVSDHVLGMGNVVEDA